MSEGAEKRLFCLQHAELGSEYQCSRAKWQHLLSSDTGYDARIRHVLKKLGVILLAHDMERDSEEREGLVRTPKTSRQREEVYEEMATHAARQFESLEHSIAKRLIRLSESGKERKSNNVSGINDSGRRKNTGLTREQIVRGVKIGSAGLVAGTLFAFTGGLAGKFKV